MRIVPRLYNRSKDFLFFPFCNPYWRQRLLGKVVCFLYHRVDQPENQQFLSRGGSPVIRPEELRRELQFLQSQEAQFLTFSDLRKGIFPDNSRFGAIICFDDCFLDNYTNGLEIIENMGIKCVFFQTTGMISAKTLLWEHLIYWLQRDEDSRRSFHSFVQRSLTPRSETLNRRSLPLMELLRERTPISELEPLLQEASQNLASAVELHDIARRIYPQSEHIRRARALGHEIGSHGHHHYKRENIDAGVFENELRMSVDTLKSTIGEEPKAFSYPFNSYLPGDEQLCSKYFLQVATVENGYITRNSNPLCLPRFTWPGRAPYSFRRRRWLLTGTI